MPNVTATLANNSIGTWKLNLAKSVRTPPSPNPITNFTLVWEEVDEGVKGTITYETKDGSVTTFHSTIRYDGKEYPVAGAPWDTNSFTQIDANTFTFEDKKTGGKYYAAGRQVISADGKTMTVTSEGADADGNAVSGIAIYDRQ